MEFKGQQGYVTLKKGHADAVVSLFFLRDLKGAKDENSFLSLSEDRTLRLWDLRSEACAATLTHPELSAANFSNLIVSDDPNSVLFCSENKLFTCSLDKRDLRLEGEVSKADVNGVAYDRGCDQLAFCDDE